MAEFRRIEYGEKLMGPGWLMFFNSRVRVMPAHAGSNGTAGLVIEGLDQEEDLWEEDFFDILAIMSLSEII